LIKGKGVPVNKAKELAKVVRSTTNKHLDQGVTTFMTVRPTFLK